MRYIFANVVSKAGVNVVSSFYVVLGVFCSVAPIVRDVPIVNYQVKFIRVQRADVFHVGGIIILWHSQLCRKQLQVQQRSA